MGFFAGSEEILVVAYHSDPVAFRNVDRSDQRLGHFPLYLHLVLVGTQVYA